MRSAICLSAALAANANPVNHVNQWGNAVPFTQPAVAPVDNMFGNMDPLMMLTLFDDKKSDSKLPLLMAMQGNQGGAGFDPMMMLLLSKDSDSKMSDLLPLLMMGSDPTQQGQINPLMLTLMDDCKISDKVKTRLDAITSNSFTVDDDLKKALAKAEKFYLKKDDKIYTDTTNLQSLSNAEILEVVSYIDFDYIKCEKGGSGLGDMLPLMMMNGGLGGQPGQQSMDMMNNPLMAMSLLGDGDMKDMLPLMMMGGQNGAGMNPLMMMALMGDDSKEDCDKKYKLDHVYVITDKGAGVYALTKSTEIRKSIETPVLGYPDSAESDYATKYRKCLTDAKTEKSEGTSDLLPLMMMGGMNGQNGMAGQNGMGGMDPMMMMALLGKL